MRKLCIAFLALLFTFSGCLAENTMYDGVLFEKDNYNAPKSTFTMGNFEYSAPSHWTINDMTNTRHHKTENGVLYSISLMDVSAATATYDSAAEIAILHRISELVKDAQLSLVTTTDGTTGYTAVGESAITADVTVYTAFFVNNPGYLQIVYSNPSSADEAAEFDDLIASFKNINRELEADSSKEFGMKDFRVDDFLYRVPAEWEHSRSINDSSFYHTFDNGNIYYSVTLHNGPDDNAITAMDYLQKLFPSAMYDIRADKFHAIIAYGRTIGGTEVIKACVFNGHPYLEITYNHAGADISAMYDEFLELFQYVEIEGK